MKVKEKGRLCIIVVLIFCVNILSGCEELYIEKSSKESSEFIQDWLAYKKQVEDTKKFAETEGKAEQEQLQQNEKQPLTLPEEHVIEENFVVQPLVQHGFYYFYLSDSLKIVYDEMLECLLKMDKVRISTLSKEQADLAFQCVLNDHPEIFYVSGYHLVDKSIEGSTLELSFSGEYTLSKEQIIERQKMIDAYTNIFLEELWEGMDEYEKIKAVYDYLITNTTYNSAAEDNQNICSVFINKESVCQGYAEATQYLLMKLGMEASVVLGHVGEGNRHAWNIVCVNGAYYYVDTTWGDADYRIIDENGGNPQDHFASVNYDYFLVTTKQLEKTHFIDSVITMPACIATQDNYYVREKLYFESVDETQIQQAFQQAYANGKSTVTLKAADATVYSALKEYMITEQNVFQYIESATTISYSEDAKMCTLCFWL